MRSIFDSVFKGYFSDGLPLLSVATSDVDASSSGDSDPPAHDSKNLVRQKSRLFPTMFHILPPRTPKVMAYLRSAALKLFFFAIGLFNLTGLPLGIAKTPLKPRKSRIFGHLYLDLSIWTGPGINV